MSSICTVLKNRETNSYLPTDEEILKEMNEDQGSNLKSVKDIPDGIVCFVEDTQTQYSRIGYREWMPSPE